MKCVILAGGKGLRFNEETHLIPKPMIEVGGKPIICHIMQHYASFGYKDFIICAGYKSEYIKNYFINLKYISNDIEVDYSNNQVSLLSKSELDWKVKIIDTGLSTNTGGRLLQISKFIEEEVFFMTYGDGVSDIDINKLLEFHNSSKRLVTLSATIPKGRFGALVIKNDEILSIEEKKDSYDKYVNGGFFVINKKALKYIDNHQQQWEVEPLSKIAKNGQLSAYKHSGFWQPMDTLKDKIYLDELLNERNE